MNSSYNAQTRAWKMFPCFLFLLCRRCCGFFLVTNVLIASRFGRKLLLNALNINVNESLLSPFICAVHNFPVLSPLLILLGYYSFRDCLNGSWYVQDLCELLQKFGDSLEFTELLTWVNCKVSMRTVESINNSKITGKKQVPCFASMLTKKLFFKPKK